MHVNSAMMLSIIISLLSKLNVLHIPFTQGFIKRGITCLEHVIRSRIWNILLYKRGVVYV